MREAAKRARFWTVVFCLFTLLNCAGCQRRMSLAERVPRDTIRSITIEYLTESKGDRILSTTHPADEAGETLDVLMAAQQIDPPDVNWYSPSVKATHRMVVSSDFGEFILYYDQSANILSMPLYTEKKNVERVDFAFFSCEGVEARVEAESQYAKIPFEDAGEDPKHLDVYLLASVTDSDLEQAGEEIEYSQVTPPSLNLTEPLYRVLRDGEMGVSVPRGMYMIIAAMGPKDNSSFDIDIDHVEVNDHYAKVFVHLEKPMEGEPVDQVPTNPIVAITVSQSALPSKKIVVFLDMDGNKLELQKLAN